MSIIVPSDFKGSVAIAQNKNDVSKLQEYINEWEDELIDNLLGCELADLFRADLVNNVPQTQRFIDIFDPFCEDIESQTLHLHWPSHIFFQFHVHRGAQNRSRGMKEMLKGLIYLLYVRDQPMINGSIGTTESKGVASTLIPANRLTLPYNRSINDYWNIQFFIVEDEDMYPEFEGITKDVISVI